MPKDRPIAPDALHDALLDRLSERAPDGAAPEVDDLQRLTGGASRETWSLTIDGTPAILRRDPPDAPDAAAMAREATLLRLAAAAGVPVPTVFDHGDDLDGRPFLLMDFVEGEAIPRRILRDDALVETRARLARELGGILARLHTIDPDEVDDLDDGDVLRGIEATYRAFEEPRPVIEFGLRWLHDHRPPATGRAVVHGDFRHGNLLITPDGVSAVLDWELPHIGDPIEDLGWLCVKSWRFGEAAPVGGFGSREELLAGYREAGGADVDLDTLRWWEVYGTLRWAVICRIQAERFLGGGDRGVEYAMIGRRTAEAEFDVLLALDVAEPQVVDDVLADGELDDTVLDGGDRPGVDGLLASVGRFLDRLAEEDRRRRFHAKVAGNAIATARREARLGPAFAAAHAERLAALGYADDAALARAIAERAQGSDRTEVVDAIARAAVDRLAIANPRYLAAPS